MERGEPAISCEVKEACKRVFASKTQAYREVLLGCLLTRIVDPTRNIRLPYIALGEEAFSGWSLDERVVNPFLHEKAVPCTRGPYLSCFRRQAAFDEATRDRLRDKEGFEALLDVLGYAEQCTDEEALLQLLDYFALSFLRLREESKVDLYQLERISFSQYSSLIANLLDRQSGGVFPCLLVLSMIETIAERFDLSWEIDAQGINVSDRASGVGGDLTINKDGVALLTIEVTERRVDASRVQATFRTKIATAGLSDYVFAVHLARVSEDAKRQAERYFSQGHDVSFVDLRGWLVNSLVVVGVEGRMLFHDRMREHLADPEVSKMLKLAWNEEVEKLTR